MQQDQYIMNLNEINKMGTFEEYQERARQFAKEYNVEVSEHIIDVMRSVMMTRDKVLQGGSFVQAVVDNNLREAISRADGACLANIKIIVQASYNAYLNEF
jgi:hypothetical protein